VERETVSREELRDGDEIRLTLQGRLGWTYGKRRMFVALARGYEAAAAHLYIDQYANHAVLALERRVKQPSKEALRAASRILLLKDHRGMYGHGSANELARIIDEEMG